MKKCLITLALLASASPAFAGSYVETSNCKYSFRYGYENCRHAWTEIEAPVRDPEQERQDAAARQKEDQKWMAFCKPTFRADDYGVHRASYAAEGCEFGRTE